MKHPNIDRRSVFGRFTRGLFIVGCSALFAPALIAACSAGQKPSPPNQTEDDPSDAGQGGTGGNPIRNQAGSFQIDVEAGIVESDAGSGGVSQCAEIRQEAKIVERPIDIIFVIDNSGSMGDEIAEVKARINTQFAEILEQSKVDYRVIMLTKHGRSSYPTSLDVCVKAPLGPDDCGPRSAGTGGSFGVGGAAGAGGASGDAGAAGAGVPNNGYDNPPRFFHYDVYVDSWNSACLLFDNWTTPDARGGPGWSNYLRSGTHKVFVDITDDRMGCVTKHGVSLQEGSNPSAAAMKFDAELRALSPEHFGTKQERLYTWYSIVGMPANSPINEPWPTDKPLQRQSCPGAPAPGLAYQALSMGTGGLRWSICNNKDFSPMFRAIAGGVIRKSLPCNWTLPPPPAGKAYDAKKLGVQLMSEGSTTNLPGVVDGTDCASGFRLDNWRNPRELSLCPATCESVKQSKNAKIDIVVPCESLIEMPE